jgi:hypothetical protein
MRAIATWVLVGLALSLGLCGFAGALVLPASKAAMLCFASALSAVGAIILGARR